MHTIPSSLLPRSFSLTNSTKHNSKDSFKETLAKTSFQNAHTNSNKKPDAAMQIERLLLSTLLKQMFKEESSLFGESEQRSNGSVWKGFFIDAIAQCASKSCLGLYPALTQQLATKDSAKLFNNNN